MWKSVITSKHDKKINLISGPFITGLFPFESQNSKVFTLDISIWWHNSSLIFHYKWLLYCNKNMTFCTSKWAILFLREVCLKWKNWLKVNNNYNLLSPNIKNFFQKSGNMTDENNYRRIPFNKRNDYSDSEYYCSWSPNMKYV